MKKTLTVAIGLLLFSTNALWCQDTISAVRLGSQGRVINSIIFENPRQNPVPLSIPIEHSASDSVIFGIGNISPLMSSPFIGGFRISQSSLVHNAGRTAELNRAVDTLDLDHNPRISCDSVDMGAFEFNVKPTKFLEFPIDQRVCEGNRVILRARAEGSGAITYVWQRNGVPVHQGTGPAGETFVIDNIAVAQGGTYRVIAFGICCRDTSANFNITVDPRPQVIPTFTDTVIQSGQGVTLGVLASQGTVFWFHEDHETPVPSMQINNVTNTVEYIAVARSGVCPDSAVAVVKIEVADVIRGNTKPGDVVSVLLPAPIRIKGLWVSDTEVISHMKLGLRGFFMPLVYDETSVIEMNGATLFLSEIAEYGLSDGERYVFLETSNGLEFARWAYESIADATTLDEVRQYINAMIGQK